MGLDLVGLTGQVPSGTIAINIDQEHALLKVGRLIDWQKLANIVLEDLKKTRHGMWRKGNKLSLRLHLATFLLQTRFKLTDRQMEEALRYNALYQAFTGITFLPSWHCPDHTAIQRFRARLSPETQRKILVAVVQAAESAGYANASWMDVDSTVQEAHISYPSDANIMVKLAQMAQKVLGQVKQKVKAMSSRAIDVKSIKEIAKEYFFHRQRSIEDKKKTFQKLYQKVKGEIDPVIEVLGTINPKALSKLPKPTREHLDFLTNKARAYMSDVHHFIKTNTVKAGKILSLHAKDVACIVKGKLGKRCEFGRVFQLGRIGGNFLIPLKSTSVRMEDKKSIGPFLREHARVFGQGVLKSISADRGYYSKSNVSKCARQGVVEIGLQAPGKHLREQSALATKLKDRRAGIEPLIGHAKRFGLSRSRMASDISTLASGYRSVLGFDIRQLERHLMGLIN